MTIEYFLGITAGVIVGNIIFYFLRSFFTKHESINFYPPKVEMEEGEELNRKADDYIERRTREGRRASVRGYALLAEDAEREEVIERDGI